MMQQINLYQDCFRLDNQAPGLNRYSVGLLVTVVAGVAFSLYLFWQVHSAAQQLNLVKQQQAAEQQRIDHLIAKLPKPEPDPLLAEKIKQLQTSTTQLRQTLQLLNNKNSAWPEGFAKYFQALANQAVTDVWLTSIYIDEQKRILNLKGSTFKPDKIAYFLQQLQKEPLLAGISFAEMTMLKSEKNPEQLDFTASTHIEPEANPNHAR